MTSNRFLTVPSSEPKERAYQTTNRIEGARRWMALATVMVTMFFASLDQTVVATAMPSIITDLKGFQVYGWVFTAYLMAVAITVPIYGKLSDIYGRKPFYLFGLGLFILGSALSGLSQSIGALIFARAVQGVGAGAMTSMPRATVGDIFNPRERGRWIGVVASVFALATIIGPTLGGWISDTLGWRWIFYINLPVAVLACVGVIYTLPRVRVAGQAKVDWQGCLLLAAGLIPLLLAFTWAGDRYAWDSPALIGMFAGSVAVLAGFFLWERRAAQPILAPQLFRDQIFSSSIAVTFLVSMGMFGAVAFTPLFFQGVLGMTATHSGQFLTPLMLSLIAGSVLGGGSASRTGRYKVQAVLGAALLVAGAYLLTRTGVDTARLQMTRNLVVFGLGLGLILPSLNLAGQNAFPHRLLGMVSSTQQFVTSLGAVIVAPILGTVLKNTFVAELPKALSPALAAALAAAPVGLREQLLSNPQALVSASALEAVQRQFAAYGAQGEVFFQSFVQAVREALAHALVHCFVVALAVTVVAFAGVWFVKQIDLKRDEFYSEGEGD